MEINIFIIDKMTDTYKESLDEPGLFSADQKDALTNAFRCGIMFLYHGMDEDY